MLTKNQLAMEPIYFTPPQSRAERMAGAPRDLRGDAPDPPQPDPRQWEIMDKQVGLSREALEFVKQTTAAQAVRQQALDSLTQRVGESQLADAALNRQRSGEQYEFFKTHGRPVIQKALEDANNYDSEQNIQAFRGRAVADVNNSFAAAEGQQARTLSRYGVMPNASRLATLNQQMLAQKAAAQAGAMTNSEQMVRDRAIQMRQQGANIANGMPAQSLQFGQAATQQGQAALGGAQAANNAQLQANGQAMSGYNTAGNIMGGASQTAQGIYNGQLQGWQGQVSQANAESQGWGSLIGAGIAAYGSYAAAAALMADGGEVGGEDMGPGQAMRHPNGYIEGPGTGTSDSVAAINRTTGQRVQLSNGEMVIPADVVRRKGTEFFERMIEKNHTPAAIQRRQRGQ